MTTDIELTNAVRERVPAATVTLRPVPKIEVTRVEISVNFGVSYEVTNESIARFRGDPRVLMLDRPLQRLERDAIETHFAAALKDRDTRAESKLIVIKKMVGAQVVHQTDESRFLARLMAALQ